MERLIKKKQAVIDFQSQPVFFCLKHLLNQLKTKSKLTLKNPQVGFIQCFAKAFLQELLLHLFPLRLLFRSGLLAYQKELLQHQVLFRSLRYTKFPC